ncbi:MAG: hypothetical protein ABIJ37_06310 [Pseudomonadota bacterium]
MRTDQIPPIFRLKTIYYILPFWLVAILCLGENITPNDLGYYIKSGELIIENMAILKHDVFTHTFAGIQYINSGWLSQVLMAFIEKAGGLKLIVIMKATLLLIAMSIIYHFVWKMTRHYKISLIFIAYAVALGFTNWNIRPQLFVIPIFAFFYSYLYRTKMITNSSILLFSLLMILWVNLHSSFPLGIMLVGIFLFGDAGEKYYSKKGIKELARDSHLKRLFFLLIILVSVTLINPYGIDVWKDFWVNSSISQARSTEWQPTAMNSFVGYGIVVSIVISSIILKYSRRRITVTEAILLLTFLLAGFKAVRMVLWWGIVSAPILATHFCSIESVAKRISRQKKGESSESECLPLNVIFLVIMLIAFISFLPWLRPYHPIKKMRSLINPQTEPVEIVNYIERERPKGNMYNDLNWGSYFIWRLWPQYKVFADNRIHLVPEKIWKDYTDVHYGLANWANILDKYKISFVVLSKKDNKRTIEFIGTHQGWMKVYEDEVGTIFIRK